MALKKKYKFGDREIMGEDIPFEAEKENWSVYILQDGTTLKMKAIAASIVRLDEYLPTGDPIYIVNASNVVATDIPEQLKKQ
ncbi:MAG: hypothetical protein ACREQ5_20445 [Candidatus Dormibacteria bacterium]